MSEQVSITINGIQFQAAKGSLLIDKLLDVDSCQPKPLGLTEIKKRYT